MCALASTYQQMVHQHDAHECKMSTPSVHGMLVLAAPWGRRMPRRHAGGGHQRVHVCLRRCGDRPQGRAKL